MFRKKSQLHRAPLTIIFWVDNADDFRKMASELSVEVSRIAVKHGYIQSRFTLQIPPGWPHTEASFEVEPLESDTNAETNTTGTETG